MNHSHILYDSDPHFKIDPISRNIVNESSRKTKLIQHDHNSERFTFEVLRFVEGHDLSECNNVEIHYLNVEANTKAVRDGVYTVDDLHVKEDDEDTVVCSWLIPNNATQFVGQLQFLIRFACVNDNTGITEYVWNTAVYSGIAVSSGIYNVDSASDNFVSPYTLVVTINGQVLKFFIGTKEEYNALSNDAKANLYAIITNENQLDGITETINKIINGEIVVPMATNASHAESATNATNATNSKNAESAECIIKSERLIDGGVPEMTNGKRYLPLLKGCTYIFSVEYDGRAFTFVISYPTFWNGLYKSVHSTNCSYEGCDYWLEYTEAIYDFETGFTYGWIHLAIRQRELDGSYKTTHHYDMTKIAYHTISTIRA